MDYAQRALQWAEKYGIVKYVVRGKWMIYNCSYPKYLYNPAYTIQHRVDLSTMKEIETRELKRFDKSALCNRR